MKKFFRTVGLALLGALVFGLVVGTMIDRRAQKAVIYIGMIETLERIGLQDQEFLREVQVRSLEPERLFSTRARTNSRSDSRFT